jgi:hypothetical protein
MTTPGNPAGEGAIRLAERLRELREGAPVPLTQQDLGHALADARGPVSPAAVSTWENPGSGRMVPTARLDSYARLFCTARSFQGTPHLLEEDELTAAERTALIELREELADLREAALVPQEATSVPGDRSMWHFPDNSRITLACSRLPDDRQPQPQSADPDYLDYVRVSGLADLDALIDIYGAIRAHNEPAKRVVITAAQDLTQRDFANHLVLIGGMAWESVAPVLSRILPIPIPAGDPAKRGAIVFAEPGGKEREFPYQIEDGKLVEDVGFFARGPNPSAPRRTLTICGGITTRGVRGAARCFIDWEMRERNERYLFPRFPEGSTYCIVMRVPIVNQDPITPDLSKKENRLFEWSDSGTEAG